mgnify:CR=1 FL=1
MPDNFTWIGRGYPYRWIIFSQLDKENVDSIIQATKKLISETGSTLIMVEHHESRAYQIADRILRIKDGKIVEEVSQ